MKLAQRFAGHGDISTTSKSYIVRTLRELREGSDILAGSLGDLLVDKGATGRYGGVETGRTMLTNRTTLADRPHGAVSNNTGGRRGIDESRVDTAPCSVPPSEGGERIQWAQQDSNPLRGLGAPDPDGTPGRGLHDETDLELIGRAVLAALRSRQAGEAHHHEDPTRQAPGRNA